MSLQVCHCGWSKVTTYHGLRTHQGRMGCTLRGMKGAESEQQNMWGNLGLPNTQQDLWLDIFCTKIPDYDTNAGCSSETSLQVCHCGWKKMTTYKGLRIHQGRMGCTPKGMRIPEREQHDWKNQLEDVNQKKHQPAKKVIIKKEDMPSPPRINVRTKSASLTAPIKEEYEASAIPHRSASLSSPQYAVVRPKKKERKDKTSPQVADRGAVTGYAAKAATIKEEPHTPTIPHRSATLYELPTSAQVNRSIGEHPTIFSVPAAAEPQEKNIQATIKQEPHTPLAIPQQPLQTATNSKSGHELRGSSSAVQVNKSVKERPTPSPRSAVVPPKKKDGKDQISPQVNRSFRERPTIPPRPLVVPPKKERKHQISPQMCATKAMQEKLKSELELKIHMREEKLQKKAAERVCESVPDSTIMTTQTNSAAAEATQKEDPKSLSETVQDSDFSNGMKVKQLALMFSATTKKTAAVQRPKEKHQEEQKLPQAKPLVQKFLAATAQETAVQQPKEKHVEEQKLPQVTPLAQKFLAATAQETAVQPKKQDREDQKPAPMPDSTSATTKMNPAAAETTRKEDPKSQCETAQLCDFSTGLKVKQLAWMFSDTSHKTAVRPKEKHNEEQKPAQDKQEKPKSELEQIIQMREEKMSDIRAVERASESVPDSTITTTQTNSAAADAVTKDNPILLSETVQDSDFSNGMKVKQLALMFSATTKKTAIVQQPKEKHQEHQEEQKLPQAKPLAQKFLAATAQETAVQQPKEKQEERGKLPQVTPLAQKFLAATAQETAVQQPKEKHVEEQKLPQMPDSTSATTKMNPAANETTTKQDPKALTETGQLSDCSTGLKVKQLAWMFSATNQETAAQLKEKHQEERKPAQVKPLGQKLSADSAQETAKGEEMDDQKLLQPLQGSLECRPMETNGELSKVMEDAQQKSLDLNISSGSLRNTRSTKMGQVHQKLEKSSSIDLQWITKFAVDVKLDPTTAHRCLISSDGKEVRDERETNVADAPERFDLFGSVLGLNRFTSWKSYWEVEVSNKTGWDLGVARGHANRKGQLLLSPDDGYWAIVHFKNKEYAALTAPPARLLLKENLQKVGVFVDYEEGLVSFYNVTAKSHIYSFTPCSFTGEIVPYFSLHLGESADPLIISTVRQQ